MVLHYSDIRISDFGFFRISALYSHSIDNMLRNFGMWPPQVLTLNFNYPDIQKSGFLYFRIYEYSNIRLGFLKIRQTIMILWFGIWLITRGEQWSSTVRISGYPVSDFFGFWYFSATLFTLDLNFKYPNIRIFSNLHIFFSNISDFCLRQTILYDR